MGGKLKAYVGMLQLRSCSLSPDAMETKEFVRPVRRRDPMATGSAVGCGAPEQRSHEGLFVHKMHSLCSNLQAHAYGFLDVVSYTIRSRSDPARALFLTKDLRLRSTTSDPPLLQIPFFVMAGATCFLR